MCAKMLRREDEQHENAFQRVVERGFKMVLRLYDRSLGFVLRHQTAALIVAAATLVATGVLYVFVPKGLLPQQDTGLIVGVTDASEDVSFPAMLSLQRAVTDAVTTDPDVERVAGFVGAGIVNSTPNTGRLYVVLKPRRSRASAEQIIARLREKVGRIEGVDVFFQAAQDLQIDTHTSRTQYQYILEGPDAGDLAQWVPKLVDRLKTLPQLADVASDQQESGLQLQVEIDRTQASRLNVPIQAIDDTLYDAFGQRQISVIFTQLNQYRVVMEVPPEFRSSVSDLDKIYVKSTSGSLVPLSAFATARIQDDTARDNTSGAVPFGNALLQPRTRPFVGRGGAGNRASSSEHWNAGRNRRGIYGQCGGVSRFARKRTFPDSCGSRGHLHCAGSPL